MMQAVALRALSSLLGGALVAAGPVIVAPPGGGRPSCPSTADLETALQTRFPGAVRPADTEPAPGQLRLATSYGPGLLRLEVRSERGDVLLRRVLPRDENEQDCRALAESVALIVDRYVHAIAADTPPSPLNGAPPFAAPPPPPAPPPEKPGTAQPPPPLAASAPSRVEAPTESEPSPAPAREPREREKPREQEKSTSIEATTRPEPPVAGAGPAASASAATARAALHAQDGPAFAVGVLGGERFGNGEPTTSEEVRLSVERFNHWLSSGWLVQLQMGLARAGTHEDAAVGTIDLWRFPARLALGLKRPLGLGQLETSLGLGGDLLLRLWSSPAGMTSRDLRFAPVIDWNGSFRAALSERLALSLGVNVGWSLIRYDLGFTANGRTTNLLQTPRLSVTPALGLSIAFM